MLRTILGAACGFLVGALLGVGVGVLIHLGERPPDDAPPVVPLGGMGWNPSPWSQWPYVTPLSTHLFTNGALGGALGSIIGALAGTTSAILRALNALIPREPPPPPSR
ncbi:MAG TPA: hypothetical protein VEL76_36075 [Gemmataceae bacterium]|nr:hypothetical protein [Gemmataceae bacterium]